MSASRAAGRLRRSGRTALFAAALLSLAGCSRFKSLPDHGAVGPFVLTSQSGEQFSSRALEGRVWVADFFFTTCTGPCPRMSSQMHWVQKQVADLPDVRLVSFTIDPARDTPAALAAYARRFRAEPGRWFFLTGAQSELERLNRSDFKLGDVGGALQHSTRFVLVDGRGRIRGYYRTDEGGLEPLVHDIRRLASVGQVADLPAVNAALNATAALLLVTGFLLIRSGHKRAHKRVMIAAFTVSVAFLVSYLVYHAQAGTVHFQRTGAVRTAYLGILLTHTLLAAAVPVLATVTLWRALRGRFDRHRSLARWTLPIWLYVSVTGVVVYWMLYRM